MLRRMRIVLSVFAGVLSLVAAPVVAQEVEQIHPGRGGSPHEAHAWTVGETMVKVTYGRPYLKGRTVGNEVARYGKIWRTGADEATTLETTADLEIGDLRVPAGTYTLYTLPAEAGWQLIVNRQIGQWGTSHDEGQDLGRVPLTSETLPEAVEQLTFELDGTGTERVLAIEWGTTRASTPLTVHADGP